MPPLLESYVPRGIEEDIINRLELYGTLALAGLPGVGKSTTARELVVRLQGRGYDSILLRPSRSGDCRGILEEFPGGVVPCVEIPAIMEKEDLKRVVRLIAAVAKRLERGRILEARAAGRGEGVLRIAEILREFWEYLGDLRSHIPFGEIRKKVEGILAPAALTLPLPLLRAALVVLTVGSIIEKVRELREVLDRYTAREEIPERLVLIIDGISKFGFGYYESAYTEKRARESLEVLLAELRKMSGVRAVFVVRVGFEDLPKYLEDRLSWLREHRAADVRRGRQIVDLPPPDPGTFEKIIRANVGDVDPERVGELYAASGGVPALALMMHEIGQEALDEILKEIEGELRGEGIEEVVWPQSDVFAKLTEDLEIGVESDEAEGLESIAEQAVKNAYRAVKALYEKLKERNFSYVALVAQPFGVTEEELREFCGRTDGYREARGLPCWWVLTEERGVVEREEERRPDGSRPCYRFNGLWAHLPPLVASLSSRDRRMALELASTRKMLLEIMSGEVRRYGGGTGRMIASAIGHVMELRDIKELWNELDVKADWLARHALYWGYIVLMTFPMLGIMFHEVALELLEESSKSGDLPLLAALHASMLAGRVGTEPLPPGEVLATLGICERLVESESDDPAVAAARAIAYASMARAASSRSPLPLNSMPLDSTPVVRYSGRAIWLIDRLEGEGLERLACFAKAEAYPSIASAMSSLGLRKVAGKILEEAMDASREIAGDPGEYLADEHVGKIIGLFGWSEEKIWRTAMSARGHALFGLAKLKMSEGGLDEARKLLEEALKIREEIGDEEELLKVKDLLLRLGVLAGGVSEVEGGLGNFRDLWESAEEVWICISSNLHDGILAEYILSHLLATDEFPAELVEKFVSRDNYIYRILLGTAWIVEEVRGLEHVVSREQALEGLRGIGVPYINEYGEPTSSVGALALTLTALLEGRLDDARSLAEESSRDPGYPPPLCGLFWDLAEALKAGKLGEEVVEPLVKLFYYHF